MYLGLGHTELFFVCFSQKKYGNKWRKINAIPNFKNLAKFFRIAKISPAFIGADVLPRTSAPNNLVF